MSLDMGSLTGGSLGTILDNGSSKIGDSLAESIGKAVSSALKEIFSSAS